MELCLANFLHYITDIFLMPEITSPHGYSNFNNVSLVWFAVAHQTSSCIRLDFKYMFYSLKYINCQSNYCCKKIISLMGAKYAIM